MRYVCECIYTRTAPTHPLPPIPGEHFSDTVPHACLGPVFAKQIFNACNGMLDC